MLVIFLFNANNACLLLFSSFSFNPPNFSLKDMKAYLLRISKCSHSLPLAQFSPMRFTTSPIMNESLLSSNEILTLHSKKQTSINES